jgi:hypothetical protein
MENLSFVSHEKKPLMSFFLQPFPSSIYTEDEEAVFNPILNMNVTLHGIPLFMAGRSAKPPTSCHTAGHTIKSGYTPSGKWRPSKSVPGKTDKRAGK